MKNLFEKDTVEEVLNRIDKLQPSTQRQWGKMDVAQMLAHCASTMDMASGRLNPPRIFIGRIIGPLVKSIFINEKPFSKNSPTDKKLRIADPRDFNKEQARLKQNVQQFYEGAKRSARGILTHSSVRPARRIGPAGCTNTSTIICASLESD